MASLIVGIVDVSGSMRNSIGDGIDEDGGIWASSIFKVIDDLVKHDVSSTNKVAAIGVGAQGYSGITDIIETTKQSLSEDTGDDDRPATNSTINAIFDTLEASGARTVRKWAEPNVISRAVSQKMASLILTKLRSNTEFTKIFVNEYLPDACRDWKAPVLVPDFMAFLGQTAFAFAGSMIKQATVEDIKMVVDKAKSFVSIFGVKEASEVLHDVVDGEELTKARCRELLTKIEPFIYGETPLRQSINMAKELLMKSTTTYPNHHKLLFIMSDGEPTDTEVNISRAKTWLDSQDVKVVGCFISRTSSIEPKRLYNELDEHWDQGAKFLFGLSSTIPTEIVTRAIFIKRGWKIDFTNNETKLFLHVNHPDNLKDACDLARSVVCSQDALSDLLVSVDLDIYISQTNSDFKAHQQEGGTCYANASAAVLHLAMHRILGRHKYSFESLRDDFISRYGINGADTYKVLQQVCPNYHLQCREVDVQGAMKAISEKRPVVARFRLTGYEWNVFETFFDKGSSTRCEILTKRHLDISKRHRSSSTSGHAVVLTSYNSKCLRLMNSWGQEWGDNGFFKVETAEVLGLEFFDVYWKDYDLTSEERSSYRAHGSEVARKLMSLLKGLQVAKLTCPECSQSSLVTEFKGTLSRAICPKCSHEFSSYDGNGNILALNVHLTSLSSA